MIPVVILAGGRGARMGGNKPFHPYEQTTLIDATLARLRPQTPLLFVNAGSFGSPLAASLATLELPILFDDPGTASLGPLSGVLTALKQARKDGHKAVVTAPCDMPHLPLDMIARLLAASDDEADMVHFRGERDYPLCALWNVSIVADLEASLIAARPIGGLPVMRFLETQKVRRIETRDDHAFININAPEDQ